LYFSYKYKISQNKILDNKLYYAKLTISKRRRKPTPSAGGNPDLKSESWGKAASLKVLARVH